MKAALIVLLLTLSLTSCSAASERTLLTQFFAASRLRDLTALSNVATVVFEPATDGVVTTFDLLGITVLQPRDGRPLAEEVSIAAPVRLPDGATVKKTFVVTMQRRLPGTDDDRREAWTITAIQARPAPPSIPRS